MSYLGVVLSASFVSNAFLVQGLGLGAPCAPRGRDRGPRLLALTLQNCLAAFILWSLRTLVLVPVGLSRFELLAYVLVVLPLLKYLGRALSGKAEPREGFLPRLGGFMDEQALGGLVFGVALYAARSAFSLPEALLASLASTAGYLAVEGLLGAVVERLELSDLPAAFKGRPAYVLSAGLMAMAFMCVDAALVAGVAG